MRLKRLSKSSYLTQIGWYLGHLILGISNMDPFAIATICLLGVWAYIFIPMACKIDGIGMGIMLIIFVAGSCIGGIIKFVGLAYFANNVDDVFGNLNARFDNLVTGEPNTFVPKGRQGRKKFPCKYLMIPETESEKAEMRRFCNNWWIPSKEEKRIAKTKSIAEQYVIVARWAAKGYVPGWYSYWTMENGEPVRGPSEYDVEHNIKS